MVQTGSVQPSISWSLFPCLSGSDLFKGEQIRAKDGLAKLQLPWHALETDAFSNYPFAIDYPWPSQIAPFMAILSEERPLSRLGPTAHSKRASCMKEGPPHC